VNTAQDVMVFTWVVVILLSSPVAADDTEIVQTSLGKIVGNAPHLGKCGSFYGVPYAAPPVGANRFRPPQPATAWTTPRKAFNVSDSCLQTFGDSFVNVPLYLEDLMEKYHIGMEPMSEDCLYLNVFTPTVTPASEGSGLPVMIWFHGGSYMGGSGDLQSDIPFYDGHHLCETGDGVIVVTVNYRLGIFGFFANDELLAEGGTAGNMGTQDQRSALEWVQANAAAFGGDPKRVTIFGESAGGGSVAIHLTAKRSDGLFAAGVMESGGTWLRSWEKSAAATHSLAQAAGCLPSLENSSSSSASELECMRSLNATTLLHTQLEQHWTEAGPCADGYEFAKGSGEVQRQQLATGNFSPKPMLIGTNRNESALFECFGEPDKQNMTEGSFRTTVAAMVPGLSEGSAHMDQVVKLYQAQEHYGGNWFTAFVDVNTDYEFWCDSRFVLDATVQAGQPAFAYQLDRTPYFFDATKCLGVPHMSDLFYLWGNFDDILEPTERSLGERMRAHWVHFATHHSPLGDWPAYGDVKTRSYLSFDAPFFRNVTGDVVKSQWKQAQCDLLDTIRAGAME
jgi:para-nitrobenzyl esterase